ncbi:MAG TPA: DUF3040 domain-containing protein [Actinomycetota bacterium]|nr:DUF3040 domain-containing protein [Actinomycetota bacterium]
MPLSEHEQKILEEIERQLYEQDPKFARTVASRARKGQSAHSLRRGIILFVLGFAALFGFFIDPTLWLGVPSFLLMLLGATLAYHGLRRSGEERAARRAGGDGIGKRLKDVPGRIRRLRRRDGE